MLKPDKVAVALVLFVWFLVDAVVLHVDREDENMYRYLTNQVWILAIVSKLFLSIHLLYCWCRNNCCQSGNDDTVKEGKEEAVSDVSTIGWIASLLFLAVGCCQFGVLAAFFLLVWLDSTLLDDMLDENKHTISEIIAWNHLRHVTVCFLHLIVLWSLRDYLSRNAEKPHHLECCGWTLNFCIFCGLLLGLPLFIGLVHSALFDDQELYRFGAVDVGSKCQIAFSLFSIAAAVYFLAVPLRSSWLERGGQKAGQPGSGGTLASLVVEPLNPDSASEPTRPTKVESGAADWRGTFQ